MTDWASPVGHFYVKIAQTAFVGNNESEVLGEALPWYLPLVAHR